MMEQKQPVPAIYRAIAGVITDVGAVGKDKVNKQQGFKFRSVDDVYNALHPALAKNRVFIVPDILDRQVETLKTKNGTEMRLVTCQIRFTFYAEDGSFIESTIVGEALDTGDKATNKAMAIAYKYACFQVFCIPTEEMTNPDAERPELAAEQKNESNRQEGKKESRKKEQEAESRGTTPSRSRDVKKEDMSKELEKENKISAEMKRHIESELVRTDVKIETVTNLFKVKELDDLTIQNYEKLMKKFKATPDKQEAADE